MVQKDVHRSPVLRPLGGAGKRKDAAWFIMSLGVLVKGGDRKASFPCSGNGNGSSWNNRGGNGNYWSSSLNSATNGRNLNFNSGGVNPQNNNNRFNGFAGRAVQHSILTLLFSLILFHGTYKATATARPLCGVLCCTARQGVALLCYQVGAEHEAEHGRVVRRFVLPAIQASAIEVLHCGIPEETGDFRSYVPRPYRASSILQLHARPVRKDIHTGLLQLHQGAGNALWHRAHTRLLPEGKPQLAAEMLCDAPRHQRLLYAYCQKASAGDCDRITPEDGHSHGQQGLRQDLGRCAGHGLPVLADAGDYHARPQTRLYRCRRSGRVDRPRPCKESAAHGGRTRPAYRQPYKPAVLQRVPERTRPVHEARAEMPLLWQVCRRCSRCEPRQGMAAVISAKDSGVPANGIRLGATHGQAGNIGGASWRGFPLCIYQTLENVCVASLAGAHQGQARTSRLQEAVEGVALGKQLSGYIPAYSILQSQAQAVHEKGISQYRCLRCRYDQNKRQVFIL